MKILHLDRLQLSGYVKKQIQNLLPMQSGPELNLIDVHLSETLLRVQRCIDQVRMWRVGEFDVLHSSQYCTFLYFLANTIWRREQNREICTQLFLLNKAMNSIDCFYEIEMPEVFLIGHSVGIVLAKATYGNFFVLYQNSTVGKNHGDAPLLESGVVMYPNTAVIGRSHVKQGSVIAQGVSVINQETEAFRIAFQSADRGLKFKSMQHSIQEDFFRDFRI
jgi:serine O-acetyltransferase